jgi:hypothetical protein
MRLVRKTEFGAEVTVTVEELRVLAQALDHACKTLDTPAVAKRLGVDRDEARTLERAARDLIEQLET